MRYTLRKAIWLFLAVFYTFVFFIDAQRGRWFFVASAAGMVCLSAHKCSKLRWRNVCVRVVANEDGNGVTGPDVIAEHWFWTRRRARRALHAIHEQILTEYGDDIVVRRSEP